ncbi:MAG: phosphoribosylglycinamide formyltransferase [Candidatus Bilamarchaeaceae archaeon]
MTNPRLAVLASGRGSNFEAIQNAIKKGWCHAEIKLLITDNPKAGAIQIAQSNRIPVEIVNREDFTAREYMDEKIKQLLDSYRIDLVILAGYMRIISSKKLLNSYAGRILNIHPSLLPKFKGSMHAQADAFDAGEKISGATVHYVTADVDGGGIVLQQEIDISQCKSAVEAAQLILTQVEHELYYKAINLALDMLKAEGKIK